MNYKSRISPLFLIILYLKYKLLKYIYAQGKYRLLSKLKPWLLTFRKNFLHMFTLSFGTLTVFNITNIIISLLYSLMMKSIKLLMNDLTFWEICFLDEKIDITLIFMKLINRRLLNATTDTLQLLLLQNYCIAWNHL